MLDVSVGGSNGLRRETIEIGGKVVKQGGGVGFAGRLSTEGNG